MVKKIGIAILGALLALITVHPVKAFAWDEDDYYGFRRPHYNSYYNGYQNGWWGYGNGHRIHREPDADDFTCDADGDDCVPNPNGDYWRARRYYRHYNRGYGAYDPYTGSVAPALPPASVYDPYEGEFIAPASPRVNLWENLFGSFGF